MVIHADPNVTPVMIILHVMCLCLYIHCCSTASSSREYYDNDDVLLLVVTMMMMMMMRTRHRLF